MKSILRCTVLFFVVSVFQLSSLIAQANTSNEQVLTKETNTTYPAGFFEQYTPQNAMEMVRRLPGFTFDGGSDDRGFGGNAGNVLIDGARPTSKSGGLKDALERIPASQVLHIEILRGGVSAGEAAGQSIVANVVKKEISTSGTWGIEADRGSNGDIKPSIDASLAIKLGSWDTSFDSRIGAFPKYRSAIIDNYTADDAITSTADETRESVEEFFTFNGQGTRDFAGGELSINASFNGERFDAQIARMTFYAPLASNQASDEDWLLTEQETARNSELGIDWVKDMQSWKFRIIALTSAHDLQYTNQEHTQIYHLNEVETSEYSQDSLETESILRATFGKVGGAQLKPEFGIEIANNRLNSDVTLIENSIPQLLEGADEVEEMRAEIFANFVYLAHKKFTLEGGLTAELSEITAYSDQINSKTFSFLKPRLSANYAFTDKLNLTLVAEHMVDQLDFNDFAASSDSSEDRTTSGNANLEPEQATAFSAIYDWRFSERGSMNIEAVYEFRQDIHEQIILPSGNEGLGNAGDAEMWYIKTNISLPMDYILENGLLEIYHSYKGSEFYDPIIEDTRTIYNYVPHYLKLDFRQDIIKYGFSWGIQFKRHWDKTRYYVDEIQTETATDSVSELFIETTRFFDIKTRLEIRDANDVLFTRSRYFYQGDRSGLYDGSEIIYLERAAEVELSFSGTF